MEAQWYCPECANGKTQNCDTIAWDHENDKPTICASKKEK